MPIFVPILALGLLAPARARAAFYAVGPGAAYPDLQTIAPRLLPGDIVEVEGDAVYPGDLVLKASGTKEAKITIVGRRKNQKRPVIAGGRTTIEFRGSHYVFRGFDVTGGQKRCLYHHGDDLTVLDTVVHDCERHGILGADDDAGSLSLAYVEVYRSGAGDTNHQLYIATDESAHPNSVFRMEHCYVHDGKGGNNVKSRAERNEIYSNWIEGARYHELELIGPDGQATELAREDSDVVGNVIKKIGPGYAIRIGGDGTGETFGRYRFVNDTILLGPEAKAVFRLFNGIESLEVHNSAFYREGGGGVQLFREDDVRWATGNKLIVGQNNWVPQNSTEVPSSLRMTRVGSDPGFFSASDLRPREGSPLVGTGAAMLEGPPGCTFPSPLPAPRFLPPPRRLEAIFTAIPWPGQHGVDIGAFAFGAASVLRHDALTAEEPRPGHAPPEPRSVTVTATVASRGGCGCHSPGAQGPRGAVVFALFGLAGFVPLARRVRPPRPKPRR